MREIDLQELKKIEISILEEVHNICIKEGFRYSISGGTMIGAVRHKGFIPWDDDIDIIMPRPDYKRLIEYCQTHDTSFELLCNETNENYSHLFAKAMAKNTIIKEENCNRNNIKLGVYIDIFPIDGLGKTYREAFRNYICYFFERELLVAANWEKYIKSKTHSVFFEPLRLVLYGLSRFIDYHKTINKIQKYYESIDFDTVDISGSIASDYRFKEILPKYIFDDFCLIEFEGKKVKILKAYDKYLKKLFGDYMRLPPENKRQSNHKFKAYFVDVGEMANDDLFKH